MVAQPTDHPVIPAPRIGVLLVNLGTPDAPTPQAVRRYLREFLSDPRVVELPRALWWPILNGPILLFRPAKTAKLYDAIWDHERGESPLRTITRAQAGNLSDALGNHHDIIVDWAMRYGEPSIADRLAAQKERGFQRILIFSLYPQISAATTASVHDRVFDVLKTMRWQPTLRTVPPFHDHPAYIDALAATVQRDLAGLDWKPEKLLLSFHGMPARTLELGDPYHCQCQKTARLLRQRLGWDEANVVVSFQSRFGPAKWLEPYTDETVRALARQGTKRIMVMAPGFVSDCLETLEELALGVRKSFLASGGEEFHYLSCLNAGAPAIDLFATIARQELAGWI